MRKKAELTTQQIFYISMFTLFLLILLLINSGAGGKIMTAMSNMFKGVGWG